MGTNFYARIIPTRKRKDALKELIDLSTDFRKIRDEVAATYGETNEYNWEGGEIHLGKRSGGWKFLWNPNVYVKRNGHTEKEELESGHTVFRFVEEPNSLIYLYPLTKEGIREFINKESI